MEESYKEVTDPNDKTKYHDNEKYTKRFSDLSDYMNYVWEHDNIKDFNSLFYPLDVRNDKYLNFCHSCFKSMDHSITIPVLSKFYIDAKNEPDLDLKIIKTNNFINAYKACFSFSYYGEVHL